MTRFVLRALLFALPLLALYGACVWATDPYHKFGFNPTGVTDHRMLNPALARVLEYDGVILGTSMVENFRPSQVDSVTGYRSIKIPLPGATAHELSRSLDVALASGKVRWVLWGLDVFSLRGGPDEVHERFVFPEYLYGDGALTYLRYLGDPGVWPEARERIAARIARPLPRFSYDRDRYSYWGDQFVFSREEVLKHWAARTFNSDVPPAQFAFERLRENFDRNVLRHLRENPGVEFDLFYPPYSYLVWLDSADKGILDDFLALKHHVHEATAALPNVRVHDFQHLVEITGNLDNYKDISHFSPEINDYIAERVAAREFVVDRALEHTSREAIRRQVAAARGGEEGGSPEGGLVALPRSAAAVGPEMQSVPDLAPPLLER